MSHPSPPQPARPRRRLAWAWWAGTAGLTALAGCQSTPPPPAPPAWLNTIPVAALSAHQPAQASGLATGLLLNPTHVLTCAHANLAPPGRWGEVLVSTGGQSALALQAQTVATGWTGDAPRTFTTDWAVLQLAVPLTTQTDAQPPSDGSASSGPTVPSITWSPTPPRPGEWLWGIGYHAGPHGVAVGFAPFLVRAPATHEDPAALWLLGPAQTGWSGGPLLRTGPDGRPELCGIIVGVDGWGRRHTRAVPVSEVKWGANAAK